MAVRRKNIARKFLCLFLMAVFLLAITPSSIFHNALAHHTDETIQHNHHHESELAQAGINCHWDNLVCEGSFLNTVLPVTTASPAFGKVEFTVAIQPFFSLHHFYAELRGPPTA